MTDLFNADQQTDDNKNYLTELVGEGKKFKTPEELAKGKFHSDQMIETLTQRLDELREDYKKVREENVTKANLEELIDKLSEKQNTSSDNHAKEEKPLLDPLEINKIVIQQLAQAKVTDKREANLNTVVEKLKEQFGDKFSEVLDNRRKELDLSKEDIQDLAYKSPTAFFRTLGLDQQKPEPFQSPPRSSQRNDSFAPTGAKKRTWSYYQELKKANPNLYYDPKIAVQMQKDAIEFGETFRDGDYYKPGLHEPNNQ